MIGQGLSVGIDADSGKLLSALNQSARATQEFAKKAETSVDRLNQRFGRLQNVIIGLFSFRALRGIESWLSAAVKAQDQAGKFADQIGVSVEGLTGLRFAASQSGVSVEALNMGLQRATRRFAEFAKSGKGEAAEALKTLGLDEAVKSGKTLEELLPRIADAFQNVGTQGERVRLAQKLFDSEGVALLRLFQGGSGQLQANLETARRKGVVVTREQANAAADLSNKIGELKASFEGLGNKMLDIARGPLQTLVETVTQALDIATREERTPKTPLQIAQQPADERIRDLQKQVEAYERLARVQATVEGRQEMLDLARRVRERIAFVEKNAPSHEAFRRGLERIRAERDRNFGVTTGPTRPVSDIISEALSGSSGLPPALDDLARLQESRAAARARPRRTPGFADGLAEGARRMDELTNSFRLGEDAALSFGSSVANSLGQTFTDVITGAATGSEAIRAFGQSVVQTFVEIAARAAAFRLVGSLFGAATSGAPAGGAGVLPETSSYVDPLSFGGAFKGGGSGGVGTTVIINVQSVSGSPGDIVKAVQSVLPELAQAVEYQNSRSSNVKRPAA